MGHIHVPHALTVVITRLDQVIFIDIGRLMRLMKYVHLVFRMLLHLLVEVVNQQVLDNIQWNPSTNGAREGGQANEVSSFHGSIIWFGCGLLL